MNIRDDRSKTELAFLCFYNFHIINHFLLNAQNKRINALETVPETKPPTNEPNLAKTTKNVLGKFVYSILI